MKQTPHQRAEAELTAYGLGLPETDAAHAWAATRCLRVRGKMFVVFGAKAEPLDALTIIVKLPISVGMIEHLPFVLEPKGWFKQHNWVTAHFGPDDDVAAELDLLKGWLKQSYVAMAPKKLGRLVSASPDF
jgi:hypothetical protein